MAHLGESHSVQRYAVRRTVTEVVMWIRSCPHCKSELRKQHIFEVARCICGWNWG